MEVYEKLEKELDDVVLQAAEGGCLHDTGHVLYGPSTVHLHTHDVHGTL